METNQEVKKKKSNWWKIVIVVLLIAGIGGTYLYQKGQEDMRLRVQQEQLRQEMEKKRQERIAILKDAIPQKTAQLQMAHNELNDINSFHFLRTSEEKEQQLAAQNKKIMQLQEDLNELQRELQTVQNVSY